MSYTYIEDNREENGAMYYWKDATYKESIVTHRETRLEMIDRPGWGISCFMDGVIQSCEKDEYLYHEALVHPVMASTNKRKRVMIIGGGEGATAREVLKWKDVEQVDMYEWDKDVVRFFQGAYPQWSKGAWNDPRLSIYYEDIFNIIKHPPQEKYDVIIIDLFDPSEETIMDWYTLLIHLPLWISPEGSIVMYAGTRTILETKQPYQRLIDMLQYYDTWQDRKVPLIPLHRMIIPYKVFIPSFLSEATFLVLTRATKEIDWKTQPITCHVTDDIWKSYQVFNW